MTPLERQYRRCQHLLGVLRLDGEDTALQLRPEADTVRFQRSWRVGPQTQAMFRGYTGEMLAVMDDATLGARLRADAEAMDRGLVERAEAALVDRARALGMGWGDVMRGVKL